MLYESGLPTAFWGEALAAFIHTSNRLFTSALPDSTPHEAFMEPSQICLCFMFGALLPMCSSRGTSDRLGALELTWRNVSSLEILRATQGLDVLQPVTKKVVISERADFDEHYFML